MEEGGKIVGTALANTREHGGMVNRVTLAGDFRVVEGRWPGEEGGGGGAVRRETIEASSWCRRSGGGRRGFYRKREKKWREDVGGRGYGENKSPLVDEDGRERRCWNQYVAHSLASCSFRPPPFVPSFFGQRRNLCYLLVTFIWSPRVLDLSRYSLSLSPSLPPTPFSFHFPPPLSAYYHLPTARSLEQPGTSYSGF